MTMTEARTLPILPLRDIVVFPHQPVPLFVGRDKSVRALEEAMKAEARDAGLWNLFMADPHHGAGLKVVEYAALAELMKITPQQLATASTANSCEVFGW